MTDETPHDGEMTLVTQKVSFGVSRDENPDKNDMTLAVLSDSGSNINIIQQKDTKIWGIPETYENKPVRLNDIGSDLGSNCTCNTTPGGENDQWDHETTCTCIYV